MVERIAQQVIEWCFELLQDITIDASVFAADFELDLFAQLASDIAQVMATPDLRDWLAKHGADPMRMTQPEFARFVLNESERAARIVKAAGIKIQ